jgi:hypothetical protein
VCEEAGHGEGYPQKIAGGRSSATVTAPVVTTTQVSTDGVSALDGLLSPLCRKDILGQGWWRTPVIPVTWQEEVGGSQSKAGPDKKHKTLCERTKQNSNEQRTGLCACVVSVRP